MSCEELKALIKKYEKDIRRLNKILKQGDKQQLHVYQLYETIDKLYEYNISQQKIAKHKLESLIVNDFPQNTKIIFKASDILSGDYYSLFKLKEGKLIYLLDGQGHGVSPALTIYAVASNMLQILSTFKSFKKVIKLLFKEVKKFLLEYEQLSYIILYIPNSNDYIEYVAGGMHPVYVKGEEIVKLRSNNLPFMNFSKIPDITRVDFPGGVKELLLYSDGLREETDVDLREFTPSNLLTNPNLLDKLKKVVNENDLNDDLTVIHYFEKV